MNEISQEVLEYLWKETEERKKTVNKIRKEWKEGYDFLKLNRYIKVGKSILLSETGEAEARKIIRKHRLAERLLHDILNVGEQEMDETACKFEHIITDGVEESICTLLGHPDLCPHGKPIPPGECCKKGLKHAESIVCGLGSLKSGQKARIAYIRTQGNNNLNKLMALGLKPDAEITVDQTFPSIVLTVGQTQLAIDSQIARDICVRIL